MSEMAAAKTETTREMFIQAVRDLVVARLEDGESKRRLLNAKMVYGAGAVRGARGVTFYGAWKNGEQPLDFIEVCACGEESVVQLAGTTIHELGHVLAGMGTGHGSEWKKATQTLGLLVVEAAGQQYDEEHFERAIWKAIMELDHPTDGTPVFGLGHRFAGGLPSTAKPRKCMVGIGTRGGASRGVGSGSRLRLWHCDCLKEDGKTPAVKVRIASDDFKAHCDTCGGAFKRGDAK